MITPEVIKQGNDIIDNFIVKYLNYDDLRTNYHLSLDALLPVMNKIRSMYHVRYDISMADPSDDTDTGYYPFGSNYVILSGYGDTHWSIPSESVRKADNIIEAIWAVTARFIMWHNEQIKKEDKES